MWVGSIRLTNRPTYLCGTLDDPRGKANIRLRLTKGQNDLATYSTQHWLYPVPQCSLPHSPDPYSSLLRESVPVWPVSSTRLLWLTSLSPFAAVSFSIDDTRHIHFDDRECPVWADGFVGPGAKKGSAGSASVCSPTDRVRWLFGACVRSSR